MKKLSVVMLAVLFAMVSSTAWAERGHHGSGRGSGSGYHSNGGSHHYSGGNNHYNNGYNNGWGHGSNHYSDGYNHYNNGWGHGHCGNSDNYNPYFYSGLGYVAGVATGAIVSGMVYPQPAVVYAEQPVIIERPAVCYETFYTRDHWGNPVMVRRPIPCY